MVLPKRIGVDVRGRDLGCSWPLTSYKCIKKVAYPRDKIREFRVKVNPLFLLQKWSLRLLG